MIEYIIAFMFAASAFGLISSIKQLTDPDRYSDMATALFAVAFAVSLGIVVAWGISILL